jgi:RNA polymerase sigma-70 factor (ECF subfamily)
MEGMDPDDVAILLHRCQTGDQEAAHVLFVLYARRLTRLAEEHLSRKLVGREDGEDVIQSVFRTFFRRNAAGEFHIGSSEKLWNLLVQITVRKARSRGRFHTAACRDITAEHVNAETALFQVFAEGPGPDEAAELVDLIDTLLRGLPTLYAHILELRMQGHVVADIAQSLKLSRQTVYRALELLQQRLTRLAEAPS